jgi:predicted PurR-regulated permease PerM
LILAATPAELLAFATAFCLLFMTGALAGALLWHAARRGWLVINLKALQRFALLALFALFVVNGLWQVRDLLIPFLIAFFLASLLDPVVSNMQRRGIPRGRGVAYIFSGVFVALAASVLVILPNAASQMQALATRAPQYTASFTRQADSLYEQNQKPLNALGVRQKPSVYLSDRSGPVADGTTRVLNTVKGTFLALAGRVLWLVIIPLSLFYFLMDFQLIRAKLISFFPFRHRDSIDKMSREVVEIFSDYIRGLAKVCVLYGVVATLLFLAFRLPYGLFLGIAAGVLYAVPYVGPALALSGVGIIALTTGNGMGYTVALLILFLIMHVAFDYGVTPRVVGGSVGLHPLVNVFALMVGATLFGVWGMLLAVPVAASLQMLLLYFFPRLKEKPILPPDPALAVTAPAPDESLSWSDGPREPEPALD